MRPEHANKYWLLSLLLSLTAIFVIGLKWHQAIHAERDIENLLNSEADLNRIMRQADTIEFRGDREPIRVPTGLFIQSFDFTDSNDVNITGFIWQKYPKDYPKDMQKVQKGVFFPEQVYSSATKIEEMYEHKDDDCPNELIGWYFDVTVRQYFDYSRYPLDVHSVWLRIWTKDFNQDARLLLVPDFGAYDLVDRTDKSKSLPKIFGLDEDIVPGGWVVDETFFNFKNIRYDSDFGFDEDDDQLYKELHFHIGIRRKFTNAFIINLVPLLIVALLLFSQVMMGTGEEKRANKLGFNTTGVIATCSALFFVVMLAHIQVRSLFAGEGLVYIEYFYLIMYIVILFTALNAYVFSLGRLPRLNFIYYRDNFIAKLAFWPVVLWMMALVTVVKL
jgi:hypothetical protein